MQINLFLIPFVIVLGLLLAQNDNKKSRMIYIVLCSAVLAFIAAMRSPVWMTNTYQIDTLNYLYVFESASDMSWDDLFSFAHSRYVGKQDDADVGFLFFTKLIGLFTHDFYIYSLIADLFFFVPFGILLYRYCTSIRQIMFAYVFFIAMLLVFFFGGARQIFSIGFDMMALLAIIDKKRFRAIVFFSLGVLLHFSSLLFIAPILIIWYNVNPKVLKRLHVVSFGLLPIVAAFANLFIFFLADTSGLEKYQNYASGNLVGAITFVLLIELVSFFCYVAIKERDMLHNKVLQDFYVMIPFFTIFGLLSYGSLIRISLYFHLYIAVLVPFAIDCMFTPRNRRIAYVLAIGVLAFLAMVNTGMTYYFYWQK